MSQCHGDHMGSLDVHSYPALVRHFSPSHWQGNRKGNRGEYGLSPPLSGNEDTSSVVSVDSCEGSNVV